MSAPKRKFAENTTVPLSRSRDEVEIALRRYGADAFGYLEGDGVARLGFRMSGRQFRFTVPLPDPTAEEFTHRRVNQTADLVERDRDSRNAVYDQAVRRLWRALALIVKAKLEAVESGVVSFEDEFLASTVTVSGETVGEIIQPQLEEQYRLGPSARPLMLTGPRQ